jgi:hypothetical protein
MNHSFWRRNEVNWEHRLWDATLKVLSALAANPRGVVPQDDAKVAVALAAEAVTAYIETVEPKTQKADLERFARELRAKP